MLNFTQQYSKKTSISMVWKPKTTYMLLNYFLDGKAVSRPTQPPPRTAPGSVNINHCAFIISHVYSTVLNLTCSFSWHESPSLPCFGDVGFNCEILYVHVLVNSPYIWQKYITVKVFCLQKISNVDDKKETAIKAELRTLIFSFSHWKVFFIFN